jgi:hypothetical protein
MDECYEQIMGEVIIVKERNDIQRGGNLFKSNKISKPKGVYFI